MNFRPKQKFTVERGASIAIGAPAQPMSADLRRILIDIVQQSLDVAFAYVPMIYIRGQIDPPAQVLYLLLQPRIKQNVEEVVKPIAERVQSKWPPGEFIDIMPVFENHSLLGDVIRTGCVLVINDHALHERIVASYTDEPH